MCMIFAVSSAENYNANGYLERFYGHSDEHPHGWGLAHLRGSTLIVKKESRKATGSAYLADVLKKPIQSKILLAHIRYATIGHISVENSHPFSGFDNRSKRWALVHNGTIFDYEPLSKYMRKQNGETDSERVFLYLLDEMNKAGGGFNDRFALLDRLITDLSAGNKLNLIFTDGEYLFAHTNRRESLFYLEENGTTVFSTQPLDGKRWRQAPFCTLLAYKDGILVKTGQPHKNEYVENAENVKMLYRIFSGL